MNDILKLEFTKQEIQFLKQNGFDVSDELNLDLANEIVDELGYNDVGIAADIITKITTHPNW